MNIFVFLGPTLAVEEAQTILPAQYLPPAGRRDLYDLMEHEPDVIAIIDGVFTQRPAVWHKEILFMLERGVRVFGSSSMGALRAAELWPYGMEGIGRIFETYKSGECEDDDEVTVTHLWEEDGFRALSDAMVNLREGLQRSCAAGIIRPETERRLTEIGKDLFYPQRSWKALYHYGRQEGIAEVELADLAVFVERERPDVKRDDAIQLLHHINKLCKANFSRHVPDFVFERTSWWVRIIEGRLQVEGPMWRVESLTQSGQYAEALAVLDRIIEFNTPAPIHLLNERGLLLNHLSRYGEAQDCYQQALEEEPDDPSLHYNVAISMAKSQGVDAAREKIHEVREMFAALDSDDEDQHALKRYAEGGLSAVEHNYDQALACLQEVLELNPDVGAWALTDIAWEALRADPRFQTLTG